MEGHYPPWDPSKWQDASGATTGHPSRKWPRLYCKYFSLEILNKTTKPGSITRIHSQRGGRAAGKGEKHYDMCVCLSRGQLTFKTLLYNVFQHWRLSVRTRLSSTRRRHGNSGRFGMWTDAPKTQVDRQNKFERWKIFLIHKTKTTRETKIVRRRTNERIGINHSHKFEYGI